MLPVLVEQLTRYLAWEPYEATPDYDPKPEPKHAPRITLLTPSNVG